ncbi:hypothetical protein M433DRAFT_10602, partial [Acidomyces richmondensis BFW]
ARVKGKHAAQQAYKKPSTSWGVDRGRTGGAGVSGGGGGGVGGGARYLNGA